MDQSMDKTLDASTGESKPETMGYFDALRDEQGIKKISDVLKDPQVAANVDLKGIHYKTLTFKVISLNKGDGATIEIDPHGSYSNHGHRAIKDKKIRVYVTEEELQNLLTAGWVPAVQAAQAGGDMGMGRPPM